MIKNNHQILNEAYRENSSRISRIKKGYHQWAQVRWVHTSKSITTAESVLNKFWHNVFIKLQIMLMLHWTLVMILSYIIYNATLYTIICDDQLHVESNLLLIENPPEEMKVYSVLCKDVINNTFKYLKSHNNQRTEELIKLTTLCNLLDHVRLSEWQFAKNVSEFRDRTTPVNLCIDVLLNIIRDPNVKLDPLKRSIAEHLATSLVVMELADVLDEESLDELLYSSDYDFIYNKIAQRKDLQSSNTFTGSLMDPYIKRQYVKDLQDMLEASRAS